MDGYDDLVWHNPTTGEVSIWRIGDGRVKGSFSLDWHCDAASGCSQEWKAVGIGEFDVTPDGGGVPDLLWYNRTSGELSAWLISAKRDDAGQRVTGVNVGRKTSLTWRCGPSDGCARTWSLMGTR